MKHIGRKIGQFMYAYGGLLIGLQIYLLWSSLFTLPVIFLLPIAAYYFAHHLFIAYDHKRKWSLYFYVFWIAIHFIPIILEFLTIIKPSLRSVITAGIGIFLYWMKQPLKHLKKHTQKKKQKKRRVKKKK